MRSAVGEKLHHREFPRIGSKGLLPIRFDFYFHAFGLFVVRRSRGRRGKTHRQTEQTPHHHCARCQRALRHHGPLISPDYFINCARRAAIKFFMRSTSSGLIFCLPAFAFPAPELSIAAASCAVIFNTPDSSVQPETTVTLASNWKGLGGTPSMVPTKSTTFVPSVIS